MRKCPQIISDKGGPTCKVPSMDAGKAQSAVGPQGQTAPLRALSWEPAVHSPLHIPAHFPLPLTSRADRLLPSTLPELGVTPRRGVHPAVILTNEASFLSNRKGNCSLHGQGEASASPPAGHVSYFLLAAASCNSCHILRPYFWGLSQLAFGLGQKERDIMLPC